MLAAMEEFALNSANIDIDDESDSNGGNNTIDGDYEDEELAVVEDDDDENSDDEPPRSPHNFVPNILPNVIEDEEKYDETDSRDGAVYYRDEVSASVAHDVMSPSGRSGVTSSSSTNW
jgi:hypothetical protein